MKRAMGENERRCNVTECTAKRQKTFDETLHHKETDSSTSVASISFGDGNRQNTPPNFVVTRGNSVGASGDMFISSGCDKCCKTFQIKDLKSVGHSGDNDESTAQDDTVNGYHQCTCDLRTDYDEGSIISQGKSINDLPHTVLINIFQSLSLSDILLRVSLVCKFWRDLCCDSDIWRDIDLRGRNKVTDAILLRLTSYSGNVNSLDLTDVRLITNEGIQSTLKQCTTLKSLSLVRCEHLTDYAFLAIGEFCSSLTSLKLDSCAALTDQALVKLGNGCHHLQKVWLNKCSSVTDSGLITLANGCSQLKLLSLEQCKQLTDEGLASLTSTLSSSLEALYLLFMGGRLTAQGLQHLAKLKQLQHLEVSQMAALSDPVLSHIVRQCLRLTYLNVSLCENVTDAAITAMTRDTCRLTSLHLVACKITDAALVSLAKNVPTLERLDVGWCRDVTGEGAVEISEGCGRLRYLGLMRCDRVDRETSQRLSEQFPHINYSTMWLDFDKLLAKARMQGFLVA